MLGQSPDILYIIYFEAVQKGQPHFYYQPLKLP